MDEINKIKNNELENQEEWFEDQSNYIIINNNYHNFYNIYNFYDNNIEIKINDKRLK